MSVLKKTMYVVLGMVISISFFFLANPVMAAMLQKQITVFTGAAVYIDDVKLNPVDANGRPVEIITYNGTTYLPVRAISTALNKPIVWEGSNNGVYIGRHDSTLPTANLIDLPMFYGRWDDAVVNGSRMAVDNTNTSYTTYVRENGAECAYLLNQKYARVKGRISLHQNSKDNPNGTQLFVYADDRLLYQSRMMTKGELPENFIIDLTGVFELRMEVQGSAGYGNPDIIISGLDLFTTQIP